MRREHDWYPTPEWATRELLSAVGVEGVVLEPCVGDGAMAKVLQQSKYVTAVVTNDLDRNRPAYSHEDATDARWWQGAETPSWVVTNPPFSKAHQILPLAWKHATAGVAMLLRLSYLEPCEGRGAWLAENAPDGLIILPRISFTGDGDTDSVTCAWMIWRKYPVHPLIKVVQPVDERQGSLLESA